MRPAPKKFYSNRENLALWTRSETVGSAVKDGPNPVLPIFSRPYLFREEVATQYLGFHEVLYERTDDRRQKDQRSEVRGRRSGKPGDQRSDQATEDRREIR